MPGALRSYVSRVVCNADVEDKVDGSRKVPFNTRLDQSAMEVVLASGVPMYLVGDQCRLYIITVTVVIYYYYFYFLYYYYYYYDYYYYYYYYYY